MRVESGTMPQSFKLETVGQDAFITFAENVEEVKIEEGVKYTYDSYTLKTKPSPTLEQRIANNYDLWLVKAKEEEARASISEFDLAEANRKIEIIETMMEVGLL